MRGLTTYGTPNASRCASTSSKCALQLSGQVIEHERRARSHLTNIRALVVEHAERVDLGPSTRVLVEWECKEKLLQQFAILRPAGVVTERGDFEAEAVEPQRPESGVGDRDDLSVERGVVDPDGFDADLLQLAVATGLRALVAEERARRS